MSLFLSLFAYTSLSSVEAIVLNNVSKLRFTYHALERMKKRALTREMIKEAVESSNSQRAKDGKIKFIGKTVTVVAKMNGDKIEIITAYSDPSNT